MLPCRLPSLCGLELFDCRFELGADVVVVVAGIVDFFDQFSMLAIHVSKQRCFEVQDLVQLDVYQISLRSPRR